MEQKFISGRNNSFIAEICKLKHKKHRNKTGLFYVEGMKLFNEVLSSEYKKNIKYVICVEENTPAPWRRGCLPPSLREVSTKLTEGVQTAGVVESDVARGDGGNPRHFVTPPSPGGFTGEIITVTREVYEKITDEEAFEGIMCVVEKPAEETRLSYKKPIIVLCSVRDPGNVGTIIRTANAICDADMILSEDCADIYSSKTQRAAMGAIFRQNIKISKNMQEDIANLKKNGYNIIASHLDKNSRPIDKVEFNAKTAVLFGNEGNGLDDETVSLCDEKIIIPINRDSESLNVSIAAGIVLWEMRKNSSVN